MAVELRDIVNGWFNRMPPIDGQKRGLMDGDECACEVGDLMPCDTPNADCYVWGGESNEDEDEHTR